MVDHGLLNVDNNYDSLIKYAIYLSRPYIGYSCLKNYCWHILYTFFVINIFYKHVIVVNMYVSLYTNMSQPITSGNMHAQICKCAYVRNHGHNNMGWPGADMPLMVGHVRTKAYPYIFKLICFSWWEL